MRKHILALLAASVITGITAFGMLVVGVNALVNPNSTAVANTPAQAAAGNTTSSATYQAQIAQLQNQITQYQAREQQYQTALQNDNAQLNQAAQELEMIRQLLAYLQSRGVIQIDNQGQITVVR
jgi:peptidoglycan hydrolase CwlO-like protein